MAAKAAGKKIKPKANPEPAVSQELLDRLTATLEPLARSEGLILVEVLLRREPGGQVLRLYVDRPEGGITLDECSMISRQASDLLDVDDIIPGAYNLEVSSPGLTRKLKTLREYELFSGRPAKVTFRQDEGKTQTFKGRLLGIMGQDVLLEVDGKNLAVPFPQVIKARLDL